MYLTISKYLLFITVLVPVLGWNQNRLSLDAGSSEQVVTTEKPLRDGRIYILSASGVISKYPENTWLDYCGKPEPVYRQLKSKSGPQLGGSDALYSFSKPISECEKERFPIRQPAIELSTDDGKTWFKPVSKKAFNPRHQYWFDVFGQGNKLKIRWAAPMKGYGTMYFEVEELPPPPPPPPPPVFEDESVEESEEMMEVDIVEYKVPLIDKDGGTSGTTVAMDDGGDTFKKTELPTMESPKLPVAVINATVIGDSLVLPNPYRSTRIKKVDFVKVKSDSITIEVWDNSQIDGDTISIFFNGTEVLQKVKLTNSKQSVKVVANPGDNSVVMYAFNLGSIGKNTASIRIIDQIGIQHRQLDSDMGVSASLNVIYEP